ncbi:hypothetical protein [Undibacterium sp. Ji49W]|uniref:hypothetical protein n=1 Tax=Undibacterium sp. Ji49W TaxID=3413040 RepID=UPI003BF2E565
MRIHRLAILALLAATLNLSGCVVLPPHGYVAGPSVVVRGPPIVIDNGPYWGGGGRHWRRW